MHKNPLLCKVDIWSKANIEFQFHTTLGWIDVFLITPQFAWRISQCLGWIWVLFIECFVLTSSLDACTLSEGYYHCINLWDLLLPFYLSPLSNFQIPLVSFFLLLLFCLDDKHITVIFKSIPNNKTRICFTISQHNAVKSLQYYNTKQCRNSFFPLSHWLL